MDGLERAAQIVKDNQLISKSLQTANQLGFNTHGVENVSNQLGYGQRGGANLRLAVMPTMFEDNRMIGSGKRKRKRRQRGKGWRDAIGSVAGLAPMVAGAGLMGISSGLSAGIGGILGSF